MIGDPKQAIYAFRGADVFTYLKARRATEGNHYTLDKNFRSASAMVEAVNHLFTYSQNTFGDVFMMDNAIPFETVTANGRKDVLLVDNQETAGITLWVDEQEKPVSAGQYRDQQAERCASEIAHLLNGAEQGVTGFRKAEAFRPLHPNDIAILVRDRTEAKAIRDALMARKVRSVYLSDQDSVFAQPQALDLLLILHAVASRIPIPGCVAPWPVRCWISPGRNWMRSTRTKCAGKTPWSASITTGTNGKARAYCPCCAAC